MTDRRCLYCNAVLDKNWARGNRKYCDDSCAGSYRYYKNRVSYFQSRYQQEKRRWERSDNGKRAGVPIRVWRSLPKDWQ